MQERFCSASAFPHYLPDRPWAMMPDLASIKNADATAYLYIISHFRSNAHALGNRVWKRAGCKGSEFCPSCEHSYKDTPAHTILLCRHFTMVQIRTQHMGPYIDATTRKSPEWRSHWDTAADDDRRIALLLNAPAYASSDNAARDLTARLRKWLIAIAKAHPTYSKYLRNTPLFAMDFSSGFMTDSVCGTTSDSSSSTSDSDSSDTDANYSDNCSGGINGIPDPALRP
jgi:hypothetical protein